MPEPKFKFSLNQRVALSLSGEEGVVIARAQYVEGPDRYLVRYVTKTGTQVEEWFTRAAISAASA